MKILSLIDTCRMMRHFILVLWHLIFIIISLQPFPRILIGNILLYSFNNIFSIFYCDIFIYFFYKIWYYIIWCIIIDNSVHTHTHTHIHNTCTHCIRMYWCYFYLYVIWQDYYALMNYITHTRSKSLYVGRYIHK